jgi:hypothetical protein
MAVALRRPRRTTTMRPIALPLCLLAFLGTGCLSTEPNEVRLGEPFELAPSQSARVGGTEWTIGFRGVPGDTRCPLDLACLAPGDARVQLDIFGTNAQNPVVLGVAPPVNAWADGDFRVTILDLSPTPSATRVIQSEDYRLRLVVESVGQ